MMLERTYPRNMIFKVYDTDMPDEVRKAYWDKTMEQVYFENPDCLVQMVLNSGLYSFAEEFLPKQGLILDGGCGSNHFARIFDSESRKVVGLDFAINNLLQGKGVYPDGRCVNGDLNRLPFADNSFDAILSISAAEHVESGPLYLFQESHRTLKVGGRFLLIIPTTNREDILCYLVSKLRRGAGTELMKTPHFHTPKMFRVVKEVQIDEQPGFFAYWFNRKTVEKILRQANFSIERSLPMDILGGLARSRLFGRFARPLLQNSMASVVKNPFYENWFIKTFLKEEIFNNKLRSFIHQAIGCFYRYNLAFVCIKEQ